MPNNPDTYGWDTVFAISTDRVNLALAKLPSSSPYSAMSGGYMLEWTFLGWQVTDTPGGAEMVVTMRFGSNSKLTTPAGTFDVSQAGYRCTVTFEAFFAGGKLVANTGANKAWAAVDVSVPERPGSFDEQVALVALLSDWFKGSDALKLFEQEFMSFDMSGDIGENDLPWLIPKQSLGYAGGVMADGVTKAIGVLAITTTTADGSPKAFGELKLSPYSIPANAAAGFVMSRELVMTNLIMPAVAGAFSMDGTGNEGDYSLSQQSFQLTNIADLAFKHELDGTEEPCTIAAGKLKLWQEADRLYMTVQPMTMNTSTSGLLLDANISETMEMSLVAKPNDPDSQIFMLSNVDPQAPDVSPRFTIGAQAGAVAVGAIVLLGSIILGVVGFRGPLQRCGLSAQGAKVWSRVIAAIVAVVGLTVALVPQIITWAREGQVKNIPDIGPLINTPLRRISWPGGMKTKFVARDGRFANGILLTVDPRLV